MPTRYELGLEPDLAAATFSGSEAVSIDVVEETDTIVLNAIELEIDEASVANGDHVVGSTDISYDEEQQRVTITLERALPPGSYTFLASFRGILNDQLHGFYRSTFTDVDGVEQAIATTQFEATDARRAFPCWDEPDFKASFAVSLTVPDHLLAISNGPEISREDAGDGKVTITYGETMKMSTYLVAFVVGPFVATDVLDSDGTPVRIIAPRGKEHLAPFAIEVADFTNRYFADYYGIPYPGEKLDHIAIPDFAFGAMENLGAVTYRETALLLDPEEASQAEQLRVVDVIAHETAHMWFGDLVTMKWWDGIWLNEAFATFMEVKATDALRPDWKRWLQFGATERPWAFGVDGLASTRPVEFEVRNPDEANEMFDALTYGKGSSVLRMMEQYLGEEAFRQGVGSYLRKHSYGNTITNDLWDGLNEASGEPVGEIMDTWILQPGYPQLDVSRAPGGIRVSQRRYLTTPDETDTTLWKIPIHLRYSVDGEVSSTKLLLEDPEMTLDIGAVDWVVANAGGHGFYRVRYTDDLLDGLLDILSGLEDLERFTLIDDAFAFVETGEYDVATYLKLAAAYRAETEAAIWQAVLGGLSVIWRITPEDDEAAYQAFVRDLVAPIAADLGTDARADDDDLTKRLRGMIFGAQGSLGKDDTTIALGEEMTEKILAGASVDPDMAQAALSMAVADGNSDLHQRVMDAFQAERNPQSQLRLLRALTGFGSVDLAAKTAEATLDGRVRSQDASWVLALMFLNKRTGPTVWQFVRRNWPSFADVFPPMTIRRMADGLPGLVDPATAADAQAFFAETPIPVAEKAIARGMERLRGRLELLEREAEKIGSALSG